VFFSKKKKEESVVVGTEISVPMKDLGLCLYEQYEKSETLKIENEHLQNQLSDKDALKIENTTLLTLVNQLKREVEQKDFKIKRIENDNENNQNRINDLKSEIGTLKAEKDTLNKKIVEMEAGLSDDSYNRALDHAIAGIEAYKNLGKNQAICVLNNLKIEV
jgi:chromosome segregation ATPase